MTARQIVWCLFDVGLGLLLAGLVAPFALVALPPEMRGNTALIVVALAGMGVASVVRHLVIDCDDAPSAGMRRR